MAEFPTWDEYKLAVDKAKHHVVKCGGRDVHPDFIKAHAEAAGAATRLAVEIREALMQYPEWLDRD